MYTSQLVSQIEEISTKNRLFIDSKIKSLSNKQIVWKPTTENWNIVEILAHCNAYLNYYIPLIDKAIQTTKFQDSKSQFISSPLGAATWKSIKLGSEKNLKRKFQSPKKFNPSVHKELIIEDLLNHFYASKTKFHELIECSKNVNLQRVKIPVSFSNFIRLRLGDILLFISYHEERHMNQINNLLIHRGFPKN